MGSLLVYILIKWRESKKYNGKKSAEEIEAAQKGLITKYNPLLLCLPAFLSIFSDSLTFIGINNVKASVVQITMCSIIVWTAIFSIFILKKKFAISQWISLGFMAIGVTVVGIDAVAFDKAGGSSSFFGVLCVVLGMLVMGLTFVVEEKLMKKYYAHPLQLTGMEGTCGVCVYTIILMILYFIPCTPSKTTTFCSYGKIEDVPKAFKEMGSSVSLTLLVIGTTVSIGFYNALGNTLTKIASATHRVALMAVRPFVVWIAAMMLNWEKFSALQLVGYFIAVYGLLVYYSILPLKIWEIIPCLKAKENQENTLNE